MAEKLQDLVQHWTVEHIEELLFLWMNHKNKEAYEDPLILINEKLKRMEPEYELQEEKIQKRM